MTIFIWGSPPNLSGFPVRPSIQRGCWMPTRDLIVQLVAEQFAVPPEAILAKSRGDVCVSTARFAAVWVAQRGTCWSAAQTGKRLGRDHTSILHARRRAAEMHAADADFRRAAEAALATFEELRDAA